MKNYNKFLKYLSKNKYSKIYTSQDFKEKYIYNLMENRFIINKEIGKETSYLKCLNLISSCISHEKISVSCIIDILKYIELYLFSDLFSCMSKTDLSKAFKPSSIPMHIKPIIDTCLYVIENIYYLILERLNKEYRKVFFNNQNDIEINNCQMYLMQRIKEYSEIKKYYKGYNFYLSMLVDLDLISYEIDLQELSL